MIQEICLKNNLFILQPQNMASRILTVRCAGLMAIFTFILLSSSFFIKPNSVQWLDMSDIEIQNETPGGVTIDNHEIIANKNMFHSDLNSETTMRHLQTEKSHPNNNVYKIPNIFHFTWFTKKPKEFEFVYSLSILSVYKHQNPDVIYFHTNSEPIGEYWDEVKTIPTLKINYTKGPTTLKGKLLPNNTQKGYYTSDSNIQRMQSMYEIGGIYLDLDVLLVRSIDPLRNYSCVLGLERDDGRVCGGIILAERRAPFLDLWAQSFLDDYRKDIWAYNSGIVPSEIAKKNPELIHLEKKKLHRPSWYELDKIFGKKIYDWKDNYAVHLWHNLWKQKVPYKDIDPTPENIKTMDSTFGQLARTIYYGSKDKIYDFAK